MKKVLRVLTVILLITLTGCAEKTPVNVIIDTLSSATENSDLTEKSNETEYVTEAVTDREPETEKSTEAPETEAPETPAPAETEPVEDELSEQQKNSIAMLNYLSMLTQEINASKNSRLFLEEAYASLINNTKPDKINDLTVSHLSNILDIIENYRMISVKRDRIQYLYEQNQAIAIKKAIPDPTSLLSSVLSKDKITAIASLGYMVFYAYSSYTSYVDEFNQDFIQQGWELNDEEAENFHEIRKNGFMYMIDIVREYGVPSELALNEKAIEDFVSWKNKTNVVQRIHFFETEKSTYESFAYYWLELANSYYEHGDYDKCIEALMEYENKKSDIFRKDYYLARVIPRVISAASQIMTDDDYIVFADAYLQKLLDNTDNDDWALRYFAIQMYINLYVKTQELSYLRKAYDLTLKNVNVLVDKQRDLNTAYLNELVDINSSNNATKEEKDQIKAYNKALQEKRKIELPPIYEPLQINCELLFALASKLSITQAEKDKIEGILRDRENPKLFLTDSIESQFTFEKTNKTYDAEFNKNSFTVPAACLSQLSVIKVAVTEGGTNTTYRDWKVDSVERKSSDFSDFVVTYSSNEIKNQKWSEASTVKVSIYDKESDEKPSVELNFKVSKYSTVPLFGWDWNITFEQVK